MNAWARVDETVGVIGSSPHKGALSPVTPHFSPSACWEHLVVCSRPGHPGPPLSCWGPASRLPTRPKDDVWAAFVVKWPFIVSRDFGPGWNTQQLSLPGAVPGWKESTPRHHASRGPPTRYLQDRSGGKHLAFSQGSRFHQNRAAGPVCPAHSLMVGRSRATCPSLPLPTCATTLVPLNLSPHLQNCFEDYR